MGDTEWRITGAVRLPKILVLTIDGSLSAQDAALRRTVAMHARILAAEPRGAAPSLALRWAAETGEGRMLGALNEAVLAADCEVSLLLGDAVHVGGARGGAGARNVGALLRAVGGGDAGGAGAAGVAGAQLLRLDGTLLHAGHAFHLTRNPNHAAAGAAAGGHGPPSPQSRVLACAS